MGITYQFYDAGHQYGFENMAASSALSSANQQLLGSVISDNESWTSEDPPIGVPLTVSFNFSGGFTGTLGFTLSGETSGIGSSITYVRTATQELLFSGTGSVAVTASDFESVLTGQFLYAEDDIITGNSFNNALKGFGGNDQIDGGAGIDTAYFSGQWSQYQISLGSSQTTVSGADGTDTLLNVERIRFDDKALAFDTDGNAGKMYRLYQAAFDRTPDSGGLGVWINQLDNGQSLEWVSAQFQDSAEFKLKYGTDVSTDQFVTLLYQNVLHRAPDEGGLAAWKGALDAGAQSRAQVLAGFSESTENQIQVIGSIQNGIEYTPVA